MLGYDLQEGAVIMKKALVVSFLLALAAATLVPAAPPAVQMTLKVEPVKYSGPCPDTVKFRGSITAEAACTLAVRVVRSDIWKSDPKNVVFAKAGTQTVEFEASWKAGFKGWVALEAEVATSGRGPASIKPPFQSNRVELTFNCVPLYDIRGAWTVDFLDTLSSPSYHQILHITFTGQTSASGMCTCPELAIVMPMGGTWRCGLASPNSVEYVAFDSQHRWVWSGQLTSATAMNGTMTEYDTLPNSPPVTRPGGSWTGTKN
jgi:hypothetical protein